MSNIISYHNFMFPFRFDKIIECFDDRHQYYKNKEFDERVLIDNKFKKSLEDNNWKYKKFNINNSLDYNEIAYYYDFVKDSLFNIKDFDEKDKATSYYFTKNIQENSKYIIKISKKEYILNLTSISLRIFDTGVGILSFETENINYSDIKDILKINDFGRRIYPQFLGDNFNIDATQNAFLPEYLEVNGIKEDFNREYKKLDIELASFITEILGDTFSTQKSKKNKYFIQPLLDDRMFVLCWYGSGKASNEIKRNWKENDNWYKFVFIDGVEKMVQDNSMQNKLIEQSTYTRWNDYGTFYGITRYSFVCLTDRKFFGTNIISNHIKTIYFQLIILLLAQRGSILRFSDEITAISDINQEDEISKNISVLYKNYLRFKNKLYFKEVTAQEQGIELYDKAREIMRIDSDITDLSNEILSLNSYAFFLEEREEKKQMNKLTKLGTIFLPGTFIAGVFGMNIFPENFLNNIITGFVLAFGSIIGLTYYLAKINDISIKDFFTKDKNE